MLVKANGVYDKVELEMNVQMCKDIHTEEKA
jgi:hypothetical protein